MTNFNALLRWANDHPNLAVTLSIIIGFVVFVYVAGQGGLIAMLQDASQ